MPEMTITLKIVMSISLLLLGVGGLLYRRLAKELAKKTEELKRQKFKNKQSRIIEEILSNLHTPQTNAEAPPPPDHKATNLNRPPNTGPGAADQNGENTIPLNQHIPVEAVSISTPIKRNTRSAGPSAHNIEETPTKGLNGAGEALTNAAITNQGAQNSLLERLQTTSELQIPLEERISDDSAVKTPPLFTPAPGKEQKNGAVKSLSASEATERSEGQNFTKSLDQPFIQQNQDSAKPNGQPLQRRGEGISSVLQLDPESNLYTRINDYARWVAGHSDRFKLEYYENGQPVEQIALIFNHEELAKLNGHWFDMFRPYDIDEIIEYYNSGQSTLYCSFSSQTVEQLRIPALQILAYVESEGNQRYQTVIEECALKDFVSFLDELKGLARTDGS